MKIDAQRKLRLRQSLFVVLLALIVLAIVLGVTSRGQWNIPEEARWRPNPVQPSAQVLDAARNIYKDRCAHCHGDTGKGDGPDAWKHLTTPTNFTDARRMSALTDGELFYQIGEGRRPMPAFKTRLTEEQRWQLVLLIRSFARSAD